MSGKVKVKLGTVDISPEAELALQRTFERLDEYLSLHEQGIWGDTDSDTMRRSEEACRSGGPIVSVFETCCGDQLWIITEDGTTRVATL